MRHGKKFNHLGRKTAHRSAMLSNMASSLIIHKRINTTVAKAKALRKYIEPILTKSKVDDTNSRRVVFSYLQDKESVTELFNNVAEKIANRPGGYTRIIKTGARLGDNAEMCMMELVDFNELLLTDESTGKTKTRRSRRGGKSKAKVEETSNVDVNEESAVAEVIEDVNEEVVVEEAETVAEVEAKTDEVEDPQADASEDQKEDDKKKEE
ncbi:MAG: 50S ribosomal protein L17 [Bacteroidota bacterium]